MDNFLNLFSSIFNQNNQSSPTPIPKEIIDQYPYGDFPIKYTRSGQEIIRKQSENRFSYEDTPHQENKTTNNLNDIIPLIQMFTRSKKPQDMFQILSKFMFKGNPELEKIFSLLPKVKNQELPISEDFPNTNNVQISSLKKIN